MVALAGMVMALIEGANDKHASTKVQCAVPTTSPAPRQGRTHGQDVPFDIVVLSRHVAAIVPWLPPPPASPLN